jgi:hypothetical protein
MPNVPNNQIALTYSADRSVTKDNLLFVGIGSLVFGLFAAGHTIYLAIIAHTPVLVFDEWRVLARYAELMTGRLNLLSFLWEDYQGHRPAVSRLLFMLDAKTVGGTQVLAQTVGIILWVFLVILFAIVHLRQRQLSWGARLIGVGLLILLFFPNQQIYNFVIGWNSAALVNVLFSVLALHFLIKSIEERINSKHSLALVCSLLSGVLGTLSYANGLIIWPVMFLMCAWFRAWPSAIIVGVFGITVIGTYFFHLQETGAVVDAIKHPKEFLYFFVAFLGIPSFGILGSPGTIFFGALAILFVAYHFFRQGRRVDCDTPSVFLLLAICLFFIATAAMASVGRFRLDMEPALVPRYYSLASPLWAALLLLAFILHKQHLEKSPESVVWVVSDAAVLLVSICISASAYLTGPSSELLKLHLHDDREVAATAIVAGAPDRSVLKNIYPLSDIDILSLVPYLVSNRLSIFHSDIDYFLYQIAHNELHKPLSDEALSEGESCVGAIDSINKLDVGHSSSTWYQMSGWSLDRQIVRNAEAIIFTDEDGRIVGIGRMLFAEPMTGRVFNGYANIGAGRSIIAYAFRADQHRLCRFGKAQFRQ